MLKACSRYVDFNPTMILGLIFLLSLITASALANTVTLNIADTPPPTGATAGECWSYGGGLPEMFQAAGVLIQGYFQNYGGQEPGIGACYQPAVESVGIVDASGIYLGTSPPLTITFDPSILPSVTSISISGVTSLCTTSSILDVIGGGEESALVVFSDSSSIIVPATGSFSVTAPQGLSISSIAISSAPGGFPAACDPSLGIVILVNGSVTVQTGVVGKHKLVAYVTGVKVPDSGGIYQSVPSDFLFNQNISTLTLGGAWPSQPINLQLGCVDTTTGDPVSGCQFQIAPFSLGSNNGGHLHTDGRSFILGGAESLFDYDGAIHSVDTDGQNLTYWAPIIAGDVNVSIQGFDKSGNPIQAAPPITLEVKVPGLVQLTGDSYTFKCTLTPNDPGCPSGGTST